jgi:hypothetical protein
MASARTFPGLIRHKPRKRRCPSTSYHSVSPKFLGIPAVRLRPEAYWVPFVDSFSVRLEILHVHHQLK